MNDAMNQVDKSGSTKQSDVSILQDRILLV